MVRNSNTLWKLFSALNFQLLSEILGQFIGLGVIILAIIFQQELRRFLMLIGKGKIIKNNGLLKFKFDVKNEKTLNMINIAAIKIRPIKELLSFCFIRLVFVFYTSINKPNK